MLTIIANVAKNGALGFQGHLLYPMREDLKRFRELTWGHPILMGRRTFESLPNGALPCRRNLVLSHQALPAPNIEVYDNLGDALAACTDEEVFVIGGAEVYRQTLPLAHRLLLTEVDAVPREADVYFPGLEGWQRVAGTEWLTDELTGLRYRFSTYVRRHV